MQHTGGETVLSEAAPVKKISSSPLKKVTPPGK